LDGAGWGLVPHQQRPNMLLLIPSRHTTLSTLIFCLIRSQKANSYHLPVTSIPVFVGYFFGRKILRLNPAEVLGGVTGSMTSGAALSVVKDAARSDAPSLGYTGAYAFANVILTLAGTLIILV
jgi:hypothetical protein